MKNNSEYQRFANEARKNQLKLIKKDYTLIREIFKDASKDLEIKAVKAKSGSLTKRFALDYKKAIEESLREVRKQLHGNNKKSIEEAAKYANEVQLSFFSKLNNDYNLGMDQTFKTIFSRVPKEAIAEVLNGNLYKDNKGLSERIWGDINGIDKDMNYIITRAIAEKKSAYELSKDIEKYINPEAKKDWEWNKVYPNTRKKVDYNAQRLARTSINHAFLSANIRSSSKNPYVEAMHWELSTSHYERQIKPFGEDECDDYANQDSYNLGTGNFPVEKVPLPHPQCLCVVYAVIPKSLEEIGSELRAWVDGESNEKLDIWYKNYGLEFAGIENKKDIKTKNANESNQENSGIIIDKIFEAGEKVPAKYKPNAVIDVKDNDDSINKRVFYGEDAYFVKHIHTTNHGNSKEHPFGLKGEHVHYYYWKNGRVVKKEVDEISEIDRKINSDILPKKGDDE
ncbi:MAG: hypothetical protein N4A48_04095 [Tepidibacter sp.]|jgi:hypothetical protein|uniref:hypothetical protein n=1 Tax=Tepidibacter sp. TaxID=2529387 RepID=UPI0025DD1106|nr:hypothetical protein [Tepidibacter sp.]MCT4507931.1 hypothetical protein [Tepidibacter sp.]